MAATTEPAAGVRQLSCQVNGEQIQLDLPADDGLTLLDVLREVVPEYQPGATVTSSCAAAGAGAGND